MTVLSETCIYSNLFKNTFKKCVLQLNTRFNDLGKTVNRSFKDLVLNKQKNILYCSIWVRTSVCFLNDDLVTVLPFYNDFDNSNAKRTRK